MITNELRLQIKEDLKNTKLKQHQIATKYKIPVHYVNILNVYFNVRNVSNKTSAIKVIRLLHANKLSYKEIANYVGTTYSRVIQINSIAGIRKQVKNPGFRYDIKDKEEAIRLLKETKLSASEISNITGIKIASVYQLAEYTDREFNNKRIDKAEVRRLLKETDLSISEIAEKCNASISTVRNVNSRFRIREFQYGNIYNDIKFLLRNTDKRMKDIAEELDVDPSYVSNVNKKFNIRCIDNLTRITSEQMSIIKDLLGNTNLTLRAIGKRVGLSSVSVGNVNRKFNIRQVNYNIATNTKNKVINAINNEPKTLYQISDEFDMSISTVRNYNTLYGNRDMYKERAIRLLTSGISFEDTCKKCFMNSAELKVIIKQYNIKQINSI